MSSLESSFVVSEPTLELLKDLQDAVVEEDWPRITQRSGNDSAPTVGLAPALLFQDRLNYNNTDKHNNNDDPIWNVYVHIARLYVQALLEQEDYETVVQLFVPNASNNNNNNNSNNKTIQSFSPEVRNAVGPGPKLYAMYRLAQYAAVQQQAHSTTKNKSSTTTTISGDDDDDDDDNQLLLLHLQAQAAYNLQDYRTAEQLYADMILQQQQQDENESSLIMEQLLVNWTATRAAHAVPWSGQPIPDNDNQHPQLIADQVLPPFIDTDNTAAFSPDVAYNVATYQSTTRSPTTKDDIHPSTAELFQAALEALQNNNPDDDEEELAKETIPVQWNAAWSHWWWQGAVSSTQSIDMKHASRTARLIGLANQALASNNKDAIRLLPNPTSPSLTALQNNLLFYNRAVLLYRSKDYTQCLAVLEEWSSLLSMASNNQSSQKRKNTTTTKQASSSTTLRLAASPVESLWWRSRAVVLQGLCQIQQQQGNNHPAAVQLVEDHLARVQTTLSSEHYADIAQQLTTYLTIHKACMAQSQALSTDQQMQLLQSLPQDKAVIATLVSLYHEQGKEAKANQLLEETGHSEALVDFWLNQGQYEKVVESLKDHIDNDEVAKARYIQALSYTDPKKAHELWSSWEPELVDDEDLPSGADLETRELPRLKYQKKATLPVDAPTGLATNKKSHDAVLRQRSRQREAYIASLEAKGLPVQETPDPERWLSKYERSYNRRRRRQNNSQKGAHQGGASATEAAKLDVAARQAARAAGNVAINKSSTAHLSAVSGSGPRRRRN